jgi:phosphotransacetylase
MTTNVQTPSIVNKYKVTYTTAGGHEVTESPRLMISVDGEDKALFLADTMIASAPYATSDDELWDIARTTIYKTFSYAVIKDV